MDISTCSLLLSVQFLLIKLSPTLCYRKVLNQGHCLLSDERKQFYAFLLLCLLTSQQRHLLNFFLMETFSTAQTSFLLPLGYVLVCILPLHTSFYPSCLLILSFRKLSWSQCLQNPCVLLTLCFKLCAEILIGTSSLLTRYSHLIAHIYKTELLIPPSPLTSPAVPQACPTW